MSKNQEIALVREMIGATEEMIEEENSDRLYLEAELKLLEQEYEELLYPKLKITVIKK